MGQGPAECRFSECPDISRGGTAASPVREIGGRDAFHIAAPQFSHASPIYLVMRCCPSPMCCSPAGRRSPTQSYGLHRYSSVMEGA